MERLWAPWRMGYIERAVKSGAKEGCVFCEKFNESDDRRNLILIRGRRAFVVLNAFPYNTGHLMVATVRHTGDITRLRDDELTEMMELTRLSVGLLNRAYRPSGFNVGMNLGKAAGAGIEDHIHMHVVPRWVGDTNFMPVIGETKILPELLNGTYERLLGVLPEQFRKNLRL
ncbi:MAG: HIT domain-containing protein [Thaumarchaeota archaeon]|nr:HIT domain-containing protein [Candidatus Calditenuaceae archaeon]MDW8042205.1 HIT domain-containing protein [Nitrososphaerota archaeon]